MTHRLRSAALEEKASLSDVRDWSKSVLTIRGTSEKREVGKESGEKVLTWLNLEKGPVKAVSGIRDVESKEGKG